MDVNRYSELLFDPRLRKFLKIPSDDRFPHILGQLDQGVQVVDGKQSSGEHFLDDDQMAQVGPAEILAGVAGAVFVNRVGVVGKGSILEG